MSEGVVEELARMRHLVGRLEQRIAQLESEKATAGPAPFVAASTPGEPAPSRRGLLRLAGAGAAGMAAAVVARPAAAGAGTTPLYGDEVNLTTTETEIRLPQDASADDAVLRAWRYDTFSTALLGTKSTGVSGNAYYPDCVGVEGYAEAGSIGVLGNATGGVGVKGMTTIGMYAVHGVRPGASSGYIPPGTAAVYGEHLSQTTAGTGVMGSHAGAGWGMWAKSKSGLGIYADGGTGDGAECVSAGTGPKAYGVLGRLTATAPAPSSAAVRGATNSTTGSSYGVYGSHAGTGTAVYGETAKGVGVRGFGGTGRGGVFTGASAQLNLTPGALATHPVAGIRGDLYVDNTGRLWFCKTGGTTATWVAIA